MGKGSTPRPYSVSQNTFASNWELAFGKRDPKEVEDARIEDEAFERIGGATYQCRCYNCADAEYRMSHMIVCPACGNKRCPHATDHNLACTNSNDAGQPGSRYE
jgi:hypothetical protein